MAGRWAVRTPNRQRGDGKRIAVGSLRRLPVSRRGTGSAIGIRPRIKVKDMATLDEIVPDRCPPARGRMADLGLLGLRLTAGGLLAGHGAQKLFGKFGGYGLEGTAGWLESIGLRPGKPWATLAGASEFGG